MNEAETRAEHIDPAPVRAGGGPAADFVLSHYVAEGVDELDLIR